LTVIDPLSRNQFDWRAAQDARPNKKNKETE
jgi:hypothetical protein